MSARRRLDAISLMPGPGVLPDQIAETASLAELGVLAASLLHELRQPMFAIKAHAQLGTIDPADPKATERFASILEQTRHVEELLTYYGALFRAEPAEAIGVVELNEQVRGACELLAHRARKHQVTVTLELADGALRVRGRDLALRQIVMNLLQNALDAVEPGTERHVTLRTVCDGKRARLEIVDSGPGISVAVADRMFEPFVTTKPAGRGTGLGLYIARRLAEEMGGSLEVLPGTTGARFVLGMPIDASRQK